jgi:hypothetical protein
VEDARANGRTKCIRLEEEIKEREIRALDDAHEESRLSVREQELNIEGAEIRHGLMLLGVVLFGGIFVGLVALSIFAPELRQPGRALSQYLRLLSGW